MLSKVSYEIYEVSEGIAYNEKGLALLGN